MTNEEARDELVKMRCTEWYSQERNDALDEAIVALGKQIEAVPIIRCKDCSHYYNEDYDMVCAYGRIIKKRDDFCSWAERRE